MGFTDLVKTQCMILLHGLGLLKYWQEKGITYVDIIGQEDLNNVFTHVHRRQLWCKSLHDDNLARKIFIYHNLECIRQKRHRVMMVTKSKNKRKQKMIVKKASICYH